MPEDYEETMSRRNGKNDQALLETVGWRDMESAPKDGSAIIVRYDDGIAMVSYAAMTWPFWRVCGPEPASYVEKPLGWIPLEM